MKDQACFLEYGKYLSLFLVYES